MSIVSISVVESYRVDISVYWYLEVFLRII